MHVTSACNLTSGNVTFCAKPRTKGASSLRQLRRALAVQESLVGNEIVETGMSGIEIISLIASIASLILAVGAIWLSIVFFKMSNEASKATTEAAKGIDASVKRLENLFDKLYSDTFSMMKDTVSDMRKHIWSGEETSAGNNSERNEILEEADKKADEKVAEIKSAMDRQLAEILTRQKASDGKVSDIDSEIKKLLDHAIQTSRLVDSEAREETVRSHIISILRNFKRSRRLVTASRIVDLLDGNIPAEKIVNELEKMKEDDIIFYEGEYLSPDSKIRMSSIKEITESMHS